MPSRTGNFAASGAYPPAMSRHASQATPPGRIAWIAGPEGTRAAVWLVLACSFLDDLRHAIATPNLVSVTIVTAQVAFLALLAFTPAQDQGSSE